MALKSTRRQRLLHAIAAVAATTRTWRVLLMLFIVVVTWLALTPRAPAAVDFGWDKANHVLAFAALAFAAHLGYPAPPAARVLGPTALLAFGGLIEILQSLVPERSGEWLDLLADGVGIVCGAFIAAAVLRAASARAGPRR
jgi:VanZ family protein